MMLKRCLKLNEGTLYEHPKGYQSQQKEQLQEQRGHWVKDSNGVSYYDIDPNHRILELTQEQYILDTYKEDVIQLMSKCFPELDTTNYILNHHKFGYVIKYYFVLEGQFSSNITYNPTIHKLNFITFLVNFDNYNIKMNSVWFK